MLTYWIFYQWITSITIEMYVESWVGVVKLDVQCDHDLLLSPFLIESAIGWLNYWWIFLSVYPMHMILLLKALRCLYITLYSCRVSFSRYLKSHIKQIEVTRIKRLIFRSDIISDIFIDIIGNKIVLWQRAPYCWIVNFFHEINFLLHKYVSSAFQVIIAINSHTIFYKEQQAFSNFCIFVFVNVII